MKYYFLNESCFIYSISDKLCLDDNIKILTVYKELIRDKDFLIDNNIYDIVPTYNSLGFYFNSRDLLYLSRQVLARIEKAKLGQHLDGVTHHIDVEYNGEDLDTVCQKLNLSHAELKKLHSQKIYHIGMLGFKPYFAYLLGMDQRLSIPRLDKPRNKVDKGSVIIGGLQTAVMPQDAPSGWSIIGKTDFLGFSKFNPGDKIVFKEV
jgi:KipI family sensor histidine kinase inhibitor